MLIKNLQKITLTFNQSKPRKPFKISVGKEPKDYPVSLKDPEQKKRLEAMRDAKLIAYGEDLEPKKEEKAVSNVRKDAETTGGTGTDGNSDQSGGKLSRQKTDKSK